MLLTFIHNDHLSTHTVQIDTIIRSIMFLCVSIKVIALWYLDVHILSNILVNCLLQVRYPKKYMLWFHILQGEFYAFSP